MNAITRSSTKTSGGSESSSSPPWKPASAIVPRRNLLCARVEFALKFPFLITACANCPPSGGIARSPPARSFVARARHSATRVPKRKASYANMVLVTTPQLLLTPMHVPRARARTPDNFFEVFNLCCFMLGFLPLLAFAISPPSLWRGPHP